jgi:hypothetical protein
MAAASQGKGGTYSTPRKTAPAQSGNHKRVPLATVNSFAPLAEGTGGEGAGLTPEQHVRKERLDSLHRVVAQLRQNRAARKALQLDEGDGPLSVGRNTLLEQLEREEKDLESLLVSARANLKELRPPAQLLQQVQRDIDTTKAKLEATEKALVDAREAVRKAIANNDRLEAHKTARMAKVARLEEEARQLHLKVGQDGRGGDGMDDEEGGDKEPDADLVKENLELRKLVEEYKEYKAKAEAGQAEPGGTGRRQAESPREVPAAKRPV